MSLKILVTKSEFARARGTDVRSVKLPKPVARLLAGQKILDLYEYSLAVAPAVAVNLGQTAKAQF